MMVGKRPARERGWHTTSFGCEGDARPYYTKYAFCRTSSLPYVEAEMLKCGGLASRLDRRAHVSSARASFATPSDRTNRGEFFATKVQRGKRSRRESKDGACGARGVAKYAWK